MLGVWVASPFTQVQWFFASFLRGRWRTWHLTDRCLNPSHDVGIYGHVVGRVWEEQFAQMVGQCGLCVVGCRNWMPHLFAVRAEVDGVESVSVGPVGSAFVVFQLWSQVHSNLPLCSCASTAERMCAGSGPGCSASPILVPQSGVGSGSHEVAWSPRPW